MALKNGNLAEGAISDWIKILGEDAVIPEKQANEDYGVNEIGAKRKILAALKPTLKDSIPLIVKVALKHRVPIYPISTGKNWGYGAANPVEDNCVVLDLSLLNKIVEFDEELGVVSLEPGVTSKILRKYLDQKKSSFLVPVSGAGPDCSIIGNALERGYGVTPYVDHFGAVTAIEAVLPDGEIYRSALHSMGGNSVDKGFKWKVGPYLDGIFSQGNFGIVTEMTIALAPIPENICIFLFGLNREDHLERAVVAVRDILKSIGNVTGSINLMNGHRILAMVEEYPFDKVPKGEILSDEIVEKLLKKNYLGKWTIGGIIYGNTDIIRSAKKVIRKKVSSFSSKLMFFSRKRIDFLRKSLNLFPDFLLKNLKKQIGNLDESFKVAEGAPTEIALPLCYWKSGVRPEDGKSMNPAKDGCGVIWFSPLVPMKSGEVREYVEIVKKVCREHKIEPLITLTSLSHRCFDSTVPLLFNPKDSGETLRARNCYLALFEACRRKGFLPYRMGVDHMALYTKDKSSYWNLVSKLKKAIDPENIISPGRYSPPDK